MANPPHLHLAVALEGAGWHPAAWRASDARPRDLFSPDYWVDLVQESEWGLLDFVTLEDRVRGRLDALLIAARVAPTTSAIGIVPVVTTTHTEPFHVSKAVATLDYVSSGRAGLQARVSASELEARQFGRRRISNPLPNGARDSLDAGLVNDLFDEAADFVDVVRRLWDSWEDDALVRDKASGLYFDPAKLHVLKTMPRFVTSLRGASSIGPKCTTSTSWDGISRSKDRRLLPGPHRVSH